MQASVWGYWLITLGIFILAIMMLLQSFTTTNTEDYYLLKEISEAAMIDAIDYSHYRVEGELKINREKFVENFVRRFAETASANKVYKIDFYEIYETPPKVSIKVSTESETFNIAGDSTSFDVINKINSILELAPVEPW